MTTVKRVLVGGIGDGKRVDLYPGTLVYGHNHYFSYTKDGMVGAGSVAEIRTTNVTLYEPQVLCWGMHKEIVFVPQGQTAEETFRLLVEGYRLPQKDAAPHPLG